MRPAPRTVQLTVAAAVLTAGLASCGNDDDPADSASPSTSSSAETEATPAATPSVSAAPDAGGPAVTLDRNADLRTDQLAVGPQEAIDTATSEVGPGGIVHAIEVDWSRRHSTWTWEVKVLKDGTDHEVEIDASTGEVVDREQERTNDTEKSIDPDTPLPFAEALRLATDQVDGPLKGWKLEWDDGRREYQFDIADPSRSGDDTEVTVDVATKRVTVD